MAKRVPDPREMLKATREVRRTATRYDMVLVCEELERRLLLDLKVDPPDARFPVEAAPAAPVEAPVAAPEDVTKRVTKPSVTKTSETSVTKTSVTKPRGGRPTVGERPMTAAERMRRMRAGKR
jgi:hypothetical protein